MAIDSGLTFALEAAGSLYGGYLENLEQTRAMQRAIVGLQLANIRGHLGRGGSWSDVADALDVPEELVRSRFEPLCTSK